MKQTIRERQRIRDSGKCQGRRQRRVRTWWTGALVAGALVALASTASAGGVSATEPIADLIQREGYSCGELDQAELRGVDRSGALYRVQCDGDTRYAMLIKPDGSATIVAEGPARRARRN